MPRIELSSIFLHRNGEGLCQVCRPGQVAEQRQVVRSKGGAASLQVNEGCQLCEFTRDGTGERVAGEEAVVVGGGHGLSKEGWW